MDVFKLAFETIVVGLLTLAWLGVAAYLLFPNLQLGAIKEKFPGLVEKNSTAMGVGVLLLAYCLGSAVLPVADQLVNDEHWPLNESAIRCQVFTKQENFLGAIDDAGLPKHFPKTELKPDHCSYWAPVFYPKGEETKQWALWRFVKLWFAWPKENDSDTNEVSINDKILTLFQQQENAVLNQASQNTENLRQLHERIVVLRGMVFSLFILFLIFLCSYFAKVNGRSSHRMRKAFGVLLAVSLAFFCLLNGYEDLRHRDIFDIPVLESLLTVINIFGFVVVAGGVKSPQFLAKRYVLLTMFFLGLAYGGWMWSEVIYDQQVISSFAALPDSNTTPKDSVIPGSRMVSGRN